VLFFRVNPWPYFLHTKIYKSREYN
jgi:hypothetical protein